MIHSAYWMLVVSLILSYAGWVFWQLSAKPDVVRVAKGAVCAFCLLSISPAYVLSVFTGPLLAVTLYIGIAFIGSICIGVIGLLGQRFGDNRASFVNSVLIGAMILASVVGPIVLLAPT